MFGLGRSEKENRWKYFEQEAFPHLPDLFRIAVWLVRDRAEAEDLLQETLSQALKSFHRYERGTNIRAWMTKIMYHVNGKRLRKLGRLRLVEDKEELIAETIAFEPSIHQHLTDEEILTAIKQVPEKFREIVLLADVEEFSYKEIAEMMRVPIGTVMSRLHRGRKLFRLELASIARQYGIFPAECQEAGQR